MFRNIEELIGFKIQASDGEIGHVDDFYFDDKSWVLRYLLVDTGGWLSGRKVLISPQSMERPQWDESKLPLNLTKEQIEHSPMIGEEKPVSRQLEAQLSAHYGWGPYWSSMTIPAIPRAMPIFFGPLASQSSAAPNTQNGQGLSRYQAAQEKYDPHLRSVKEVIGYHIHARDGEIGHVETMIVNDQNWSIMYLVVDTRNWLPGKKVLVALEWVEQVLWTEQLVYIDLNKETIKNSPEYDPEQPFNRAVETSLYEYYQRPIYW